MNEPKLTSTKHQFFEDIKETNKQGEEFWYGRALSKVLGYAEYRNFLPVINKAMTACEQSGQNIADHFVEVHEMVSIGSYAKREMESFALTTI